MQNIGQLARNLVCCLFDQSISDAVIRWCIDLPNISRFILQWRWPSKSQPVTYSALCCNKRVHASDQGQGTVRSRTVATEYNIYRKLGRVLSGHAVSTVSLSVSQRGGPPAWGFGQALTTLHRKNLKMLRKISQVQGLGLILRYVEKGFEIRHLVQDREGTGGGHLWMRLWDTVGLSKMNNYSTPAVFIMRRFLVQWVITGRDIP
jgi:hypothetical protein